MDSTFFLLQRDSLPRSLSLRMGIPRAKDSAIASERNAATWCGARLRPLLPSLLSRPPQQCSAARARPSRGRGRHERREARRRLLDAAVLREETGELQSGSGREGAPWPLLRSIRRRGRWRAGRGRVRREILGASVARSPAAAAARARPCSHGEGRRWPAERDNHGGG